MVVLVSGLLSAGSPIPSLGATTSGSEYLGRSLPESLRIFPRGCLAPVSTGPPGIALEAWGYPQGQAYVG